MRKIILIALVSLIHTSGFSQKTVKAALVAFYNLENLFDTVDDTTIWDEEYLPDGEKQWTMQRYQEKLLHMSDVISQIGDPVDGSMHWGGPTFLGVCEIENKTVLEDLLKTPKLKDKNYGIVHYDSPDKRGVDVGFLYKKDFFKVISSKKFKLDRGDGRTTRDQLLVSGVYDSDTLHFIVNHWPSRGGPSPVREAAATLCRSIVDSLLDINKNAKVFVMGDLNDYPTNKSLQILKHKSTKKKPQDENVIVLFNPMEEMHKKGFGTHAYHDIWGVFDQIIITPGVVNGANGGYKYQFADRWMRPFMLVQDGNYKGYPKRTHVGSKYLAGYSDHVPVYMYIVKEE